MPQLAAMAGNPGAARGLLATLQSAVGQVESKVTAADEVIEGMFTQFNGQVSAATRHQDDIEYLLTQLAEATFQLLPTEAGIAAVKAAWCKTGKEQKGDPQGVLYLTDQRVIFEQKEEIATKKVLFVVTEKQKVQGLLMQAPVALVDKYASGMDGTVVKVESGIITSVIPPHLQDKNFDFSDKYKTLNIYKFSKDFCNAVFKKLLTYYAKVINDNCYYELILGILIYMQQETVHAEILEGEKWAEVDDPNDLHGAEFIFNHQRRGAILEEGFGGFWHYDILDFCFIRNMYFPNSSILSEIKNNVPDLLHNYGSRQALLNQKLAWLLLCNNNNVHALNGSSQAYPLLAVWLKGKKALLPTPTFGEYPRIFPGTATYRDAVGIKKSDIKEKAEDCEVIVFVNPNNPTGSFIETQWIADFASRNPAKTIIVDESFIEFSGGPPVLELLEKSPLANVIIIKSLSKSMGMPGLRLGYAYSCNAEFNEYIKKSLPIWNLNSMAEFAMEIILKHRKSLAQSFADTIRDREEFRKELSGLACVETVYPSAANFVLLRLKQNAGAAKIAETLLSRHSIYVKDISSKFADGRSYLRLAVRLPHENALLVKCLEEVGEGAIDGKK